MATQSPTTARAVPARDRDGRHALSHDFHWECEQDDIGARVRDEARKARANSLETLGAALDDAMIRFRRQADRPVIEPTAFARAERRFLAARDAYMARLCELTGEGTADLQRRVAA